MQPTNSSQALSELQSFQKSRRRPEDILREQETKLGIPTAQQRQTGLRAAITNTENLVRAVEPSVSGRTSGSLVTEAQKNRLVGLERAPLDDAYREQSRAYDTGTTELSNLQSSALRQAELSTTADANRLTEMQGMYSLLYGREQDAIAKAERDAEIKRQAAASAGLSGLLGGGGGSTEQRQQAAGTFKATKQSGGNFNFTDSNGNAISAATYAAATGKSFRSLLQEMANQGDKGASKALGFVGDDFGYDASKVDKGLYDALTWGFKPGSKAQTAPNYNTRRTATKIGVSSLLGLPNLGMTAGKEVFNNRSKIAGGAKSLLGRAKGYLGY